MSKAKGDNGEGLYVRGRTNHRDSQQSRGKSRSKSRGGRLKCYIFQSDDHLKRDYSKNNRKKSTRYVKKDDQPSSSNLIYDGSKVMKVMMVMSVEAMLEYDEGRVLLGDNKECKINGIGKLFYLEHEVIAAYSLDGHAMAIELNVSVEEKDGLAQVLAQKTRTYQNAHYSGSDRLYSFRLMWSFSGGIIRSKRHFLSIVDDYSRRVWVDILRFKHEAFEKFKEWKQLVENQTGRTVKKPRTDNGLEFCNREFEQLCTKSEIARHLTVTGMPQQNGLAERMNKTLMDKVRYLLIQYGLPKTFWAEVTCTVSSLINRSPSIAIEKKTSMEMWSGHRSDYGMLRIFSCVVYSHVKQDKLEPRAVKCVLLGYPEGAKGYMLYRLDNESPKIITSMNVVFNESVMYKDTLKDYGASTHKSVEELQVEVDLQGLNNPEEEDTHEPLTYQEVVACEDSSKWKAAMKKDMDSLRKNKTWELVDHPAGQKLVSCKWLFKIKEGIEGVQKPSYKARLVARRFTQRADYELEQLDIKTVFLHENLEEVIYMRQPPGYEQGNKIACKSKFEIGYTKSLLKKEFDMKELGEAKKILVHNGKSVNIPLDEHFKLSLKDCPVRDYDVEMMSKVTYANALGSLMYLIVCTRPDIVYAVSVVSKYLANPDYAKDPDKGKSITSYTFLVQRCVVSWKAMLQHVVAISTTNAEYMALTKAVKEAIWLRGLLEELGVELNIVAVNRDNYGSIYLSQNHVFHERTKHINVRYHFIREVLEAKTVEVLKVGTKHNAANALTKVVPGLKLQYYLELLSVGICEYKA
ncbi:retrotransposon protein, putative, ty1-copia subclass [Tanacetum coccineum]|uniref:Retrotransposon protein, putative, ty1-copia subclass n=1 Tax=Tanacetum coccineum TaxID=301880 RepID=A0ABQ5I9Q6_9ASTR